MRKDYAREKDYVLMVGYVLKHTALNPSKKSKNFSKAPALLVFSSKNFSKALSTTLKAKSELAGPEWIYRLANDKLVDRTHFLSINYYLMDPEEGIGYKAVVSVENFNEDTLMLTEGKERLDLTGSADLLNKLISPLRMFLNLKSDDLLFNPKYLENFDKRLDYIIDKYTPTSKSSESKEDLPKGDDYEKLTDTEVDDDLPY
jgi:hypothetical protein